MYKFNQKILLVEDDLLLGETIAELISYNGYKVIWNKNGSEALETLRTYVPDVIICDLMMPVMDGDVFFNKIRNQRRYDNIPFIMITANINTDVKFKQLENGVNDFISKPFVLKELLLKVKNLLQFNANLEKKIAASVRDHHSKVIKSKDFFTSLDELLLLHIEQPISHDFLASELFVSKSTLDKKIRKFKNQNISQYIKTFRVEYAIMLMENGESNMELIAAKSGFSSASYFSTSFKSVKGDSPKKFYKNLIP
jgi:DNA-binding response OmpR family regulator